MSENKAFRDSLIRLGICIVFAICYCLGGWGDFLGGAKWIRRFLAPSILCGGIFWYTRDWKSLAQLPLTFASLSLGYGSDVEFLKIIKRSIFGVANSLSFNLYNLLNKKFIVPILNTVVVTSSCVFLGVYNPLSDARAEELVVGFLIGVLPIMSAKRKE